ncbi:HesB/YadR/YfhF family protein [Enterococcus camelliae]|jgi:uncharacterized protein YneR|uniref:HesB/YadR/YfhF family protein n=1 Tax=Enterococcus camelliae TaxID=453959 RepID=A0ABW5THR9_9ENTE
MQLTITPQALEWFQKEIQLEPGMGIKFYGKVYGKTQVHDGFSVGLSVDRPDKPLVETTVSGILFFIEETDEWFFKRYDLVVDYNSKLDEPTYVFEESKG